MLAARDLEHGTHSPRVTALVVDSLAHALARVLTFDGPADAVMSRFFLAAPNSGSRDRSLVAEAIFFALRHYGRCRGACSRRYRRVRRAWRRWSRWRGSSVSTALDPRALRGDAAAVRSAAAQSTCNEHRHRCAPSCRTGCFSRSSAVSTTPKRCLRRSPNRRRSTCASTRSRRRATMCSTNCRPMPSGLKPRRYRPRRSGCSTSPALTRWPAYQTVAIEVQDEGSQLIARLVRRNAAKWLSTSAPAPAARRSRSVPHALERAAVCVRHQRAPPGRPRAAA